MNFQGGLLSDFLTAEHLVGNRLQTFLWTCSFHIDLDFLFQSRLRSPFGQKYDFHKNHHIDQKNFRNPKFFFPWKPPWTKLFWLPTWCWSHENYPLQAKVSNEKIQISEKWKFPKKFSLRYSTAPSDFWPKPMYLRTLWEVAIMISPMPVLNLSDSIPTTGPFCGNSPVK